MTDPSGRDAISFMYSARDTLVEWRESLGPLGDVLDIGIIALTVGIVAYENRHTLAMVGSVITGAGLSFLNSTVTCNIELNGIITGQLLRADMLVRVCQKTQNGLYSIHHVIPLADPRGYFGRIMLWSCGIDADSAEAVYTVLLHYQKGCICLVKI